MARQIINNGSDYDDNTGDRLRDAWEKANANFLELYSSFTYNIPFAFNTETDNISIGSTKITFVSPNFDITITGVSVNLNTPPIGADATFDILVGGVSILSTVVTIDDGDTNSEDSATPPVISTALVSANSVITLDILTIGTTLAGTGGKSYIYYTKA